MILLVYLGFPIKNILFVFNTQLKPTMPLHLPTGTPVLLILGWFLFFPDTPWERVRPKLIDEAEQDQGWGSVGTAVAMRVRSGQVRRGVRGPALALTEPGGGRTRSKEGGKAKAQARPRLHTETYIVFRPNQTLDYGREQRAPSCLGTSQPCNLFNIFTEHAFTEPLLCVGAVSGSGTRLHRRYDSDPSRPSRHVSFCQGLFVVSGCFSLPEGFLWLIRPGTS